MKAPRSNGVRGGVRGRGGRGLGDTDSVGCGDGRARRFGTTDVRRLVHDGRIQPQPSSDGLFEELLEKGQLKETPLDELVAEAIEQGRNEPNDDILDMLETLHDRLVRAEGMVADEIARRRR
jgi:hypothetical protein